MDDGQRDGAQGDEVLTFPLAWRAVWPAALLWSGLALTWVLCGVTFAGSPPFDGRTASVVVGIIFGLSVLKALVHLVRLARRWASREPAVSVGPNDVALRPVGSGQVVDVQVPRSAVRRVGAIRDMPGWQRLGHGRRAFDVFLDGHPHVTLHESSLGDHLDEAHAVLSSLAAANAATANAAATNTAATNAAAAPDA